MKHRLLFLSIFFLTIFSLVAQDDTEASPSLSDIPPLDSLYPERVVYDMFDIEVPPKYPGGEKELLKYLAENIKYPAVTRDSYIPGPFAVSFIVEADGSISTKKVMRTNEAFAKAVLEGIDQMPRWSPGMKNGEPVAVQFIMPIRLCYRD